jgi:hypothetical protein
MDRPTDTGMPDTLLEQGVSLNGKPPSRLDVREAARSFQIRHIDTVKEFSGIAEYVVMHARVTLKEVLDGNTGPIFIGTDNMIATDCHSRWLDVLAAVDKDEAVAPAMKEPLKAYLREEAEGLGHALELRLKREDHQRRGDAPPVNRG